MALILGLCLLVWTTQFSSGTAYLPNRGDAEWILYPAPTRLGPRKSVPFVTRFYRQFHVERVPEDAPLHIRALRSAQVWLNGQKITEAAVSRDSWKRGTQCNVAQSLLPGENELLVEVENSDGPPILWLELALGDRSVISGADWYASLAAAPWLPVRIAGTPADVPRIVPVEEAKRHGTSHFDVQEASRVASKPVPSLARQLRLPSDEQFTLAALRTSWRRLTLWSAVAVCLAWGCLACLSTERIRSLWPSSFGLWLLLVFFLGCWAALLENNAPSLTPGMGFDSDSHHEYIAYVQTNRRLPLADEGWEMFQPPLYYVTAATLLSALGDSPYTDTGAIWLRRLNLLYGWMHLVCTAFALRLAFPQHLRRQMLGLVFAACLPVHLYLFQHVTNDLAAAAFGSLALCTALAVLRRPAIGWRAAISLGATLGLVLMAKATGLALVLAALLALACQLWTENSLSTRTGVRFLASVAAACALVISVHYGRTWWHFGTPLVGNWDPRTGLHWWSDPGYRTAAAYLPRADVLLSPLLNGASNVWSTLYSTLWGDGFLSASAGARLKRPPWNYPAMLAGYALAVIPFFGLLVGAVALCRLVWRALTPVQLLLIGAPVMMFAAMFWMTLSVPGFGQTKAVYLLPIAACLSAVAGWGWDLLAGASRWRSCLVLGLIGLWGANSFFAFWVPRQSIAARTTRAFYLVTADPARAMDEFNGVLAERPDSIEARAGLGLALSHLGRPTEARQELQTALARDPGFVEAYLWLAETLESLGQFDQAIEIARAARCVAPDASAVAEYTGLLLARQGNDEEAQQVLTDTLRLDADEFPVHYSLADLYARHGDFHRAFECARQAAHLRPSDDRAQYLLAQNAAELGRDAEAIAACQAVLQARPEEHAVLTLLAWVLATSADDMLRDPVEAIRLARLADRASGGKDPEPLDALAAALATIGNFEKAKSAASGALARARVADKNDLLGPLEARRALYAAGRAYRRPAYREMVPAVELDGGP